MLTRGANQEDTEKIKIELDKPLPGQARKPPSSLERQKINQEWASFMQSVG